MKTAFGEQVKAARERLGLSQPKLAALAKIDPKTVGRVERGAPYDAETEDKLCQALASKGEQIVATGRRLVSSTKQMPKALLTLESPRQTFVMLAVALRDGALAVEIGDEEATPEPGDGSWLAWLQWWESRRGQLRPTPTPVTRR